MRNTRAVGLNTIAGVLTGLLVLLGTGEYGIVLRPISKTMKFSGADVARNQGNGKVLNSVWSFEVK